MIAIKTVASAQIESESVESVKVLRTGERRRIKKMSTLADRRADNPFGWV